MAHWRSGKLPPEDAGDTLSTNSPRQLSHEDRLAMDEQSRAARNASRAAWVAAIAACVAAVSAVVTAWIAYQATERW